MHRQSASRNHRSKGFKLKHVLQICVLVAVCFWLIYQVTLSIDKKKEFDHNDMKISEDAQKDDEILKFGRKDLNLQVNKKAKDTEKHDEEVEEEIVEEEEDVKHEEEIVEEEDKHEEEEEEEQKEDHETQKKEVESREDGNDENEHNQEKPDPDVDHEEFMDDEKDIEEEGDKESEEKDIEDNDRQVENENSLEDHDHDKEIRNSREEHYKGDDASSAVTHGLPVNTEIENGSVENHVNVVEHENKDNITEESYVGQNTTDFKLQETTKSGTLTVDEEKGDDVVSTFEGSSSLNSTTASGSNDKPESSNDSIISDTSYSQNVTGGTVSAEGSNFQSLPLEQTNNSSIVVDNNNNSQLDSNLITSNASESTEGNTTWPSNSITNSHLVVTEYFTESNVSAETKDDSEAHTTEVKTEARTDGDYESSDSNNSENTDEVQHDNFDSSESSILLDEKGIHVNLNTLPDIRTEGSNSEEAAEE